MKLTELCDLIILYSEKETYSPDMEALKSIHADDLARACKALYEELKQIELPEGDHTSLTLDHKDIASIRETLKAVDELMEQE
jgi:hypothetical protein